MALVQATLFSLLAVNGAMLYLSVLQPHPPGAHDAPGEGRGEAAAG